MKKLPLFLFIAALLFLVYVLCFWKDANIKIPLKKKPQASASKKTGGVNKSEFTKLEVSGVFEVDVSYSSTEKVEIEAPSHIKKRIKKRVKSNTLYFEIDGGKNLLSAGKVKVHISTAKLNDFSISGSASVRLNDPLKDSLFRLKSSGATTFKGNIRVEKAEIELDGAAKVNLNGAAGSAKLELAGASKLNNYGFEVNDLNINLSGASSVNIAVLKSIEGDLSGAASLHFDGNPNVDAVTTSGAARFGKR